MATIYEIGQEYRKRLLAGDAAVAADLVDTYAGALTAIQSEAAALMAELEALGDVPGSVTKSYMIEKAGLVQFEKSAAEELARVNALASGTIEGQQRTAARLAMEAFNAALAAGKAPDLGMGIAFNQVASDAVEALAGYLSDGSPLNAVLAKHAGDSASLAAQELKVGLAAGLPTRQIAQNIADATGADLDKVLTIARTETLRAYRETAFEAYDANDDVVASWMWVCGMQPNSCAACVAMHGTIHPLTERMHGHPNCGCASVPILEGIPLEEQRPPQSSEEWLAAQDDDVLAQVFGSRKQAERYKAGQFALRDVVRITDSPEWGRTVSQKVAPPKAPGASGVGQAVKPKPKTKPKQKAAPKPKPAPKTKPEPKTKTKPKPAPKLKPIKATPVPAPVVPAPVVPAPAPKPKAPPRVLASPEAKAEWKRLQRGWIRTSHGAEGKALRSIAVREYGARGSASTVATVATAQEVAGVQWAYAETQRHLAAEGIKTIKLYRGIKAGHGFDGRFSAESWTDDINIARKFGEVIEREVQAADVLAYHGGPNWHKGSFAHEREWLLINRGSVT